MLSMRCMCCREFLKFSHGSLGEEISESKHAPTLILFMDKQGGSDTFSMSIDQHSTTIDATFNSTSVHDYVNRSTMAFPECGKVFIDSTSI